VVDPENSETIIESIYSADIREVIFEKSFHNVALDYEIDLLNEQSQIFIEEVLSGEIQRDADFNERELIDAEFDSIVSGLSLDQSAPTTYLDELNPKWPKFDQTQRAGLISIGAGVAYLVINRFTSFDIAGVWPGLIAICGGVATLIWRTARLDDGDEGAKL
jgi:hypothetical protein